MRRTDASVLASVPALLALLITTPAWAESGDADTSDPSRRPGARTHDGFLLEARLGVGLGVLDSNASASNGFQEPIPQSASGPLLPVVGAAAGWTTDGLVIGGFAGHAALRGPTIETGDESSRVAGLQLSVIHYGLFARYYPEPEEGLQFGGGLAYAYVQARGGRERLIEGAGELTGGRTLKGAAAFLEAGHGVWLGNQFSLNGALRFDVGHVGFGDGPSATYVLSTLSALITYH